MGNEKYIEPQRNVPYMTERNDLKEMLRCADWVSTARAIREIVMGEVGGLIRPGDYFRIPVKAAAGSFGGLRFEALDIPDAELVVVENSPEGKIIFNFEEVLFYSAINPENTGKGGFKESALCEYLNGPFLDALDPIRDVLAKNKDGNLVTLPTIFEVFGDDVFGRVNWEESPTQFEYFRKVKNRIRVKDDDPKWWWLSTAASATDFAAVNSDGQANSYGIAGIATGGVAPAICIS